jgi:hypothetical protein
MCSCIFDSHYFGPPLIAEALPSEFYQEFSKWYNAGIGYLIYRVKDIMARTTKWESLELSLYIKIVKFWRITDSVHIKVF